MPRLNNTPSPPPVYSHCPVCGWESPYLVNDERWNVTGCDVCQCLFTIQSGRVVQDPPITCDAERAGYPCPNPMHIEYGRRYAQQEAVRRGAIVGRGSSAVQAAIEGLIKKVDLNAAIR